LAAIAKEIPKPIRFIGLGEGIDDLKVFNADDYVEAMFD
jgi:fused signal recognition particle receptor